MPLTAAEALSRHAMEALVHNGKAEDERFSETWVISITSPCAPPIPWRASAHLLQLQFEDLDPDRQGRNGTGESYTGPEEYLMSPAQAAQMAAFIARAHARPGRILLRVHCEAGISRSGAVVTVAARACGLDPRDLRRANPLIDPNHYVMRLLREAMGLQAAPVASPLSCVG